MEYELWHTKNIQTLTTDNSRRRKTKIERLIRECRMEKRQNKRKEEGSKDVGHCDKHVHRLRRDFKVTSGCLEVRVYVVTSFMKSRSVCTRCQWKQRESIFICLQPQAGGSSPKLDTIYAWILVKLPQRGLTVLNCWFNHLLCCIPAGTCELHISLLLYNQERKSPRLSNTHYIFRCNPSLGQMHTKWYAYALFA